MSAAAFILILLFLLGLLTIAYYAAICIPVALERSHAPAPVDHEKSYLIPLQSYDDDRKKVPNALEDRLLNPQGNGGVPNAMIEDDSFAGNERPVEGAAEGLQSLDVPDCSMQVKPVSESSPKHDKTQQYSARPCGVPNERSPLLQGDEEDGLILCQPNVQSDDREEEADEPSNASNLMTVSVPVQVTPEPVRTKSVSPVQVLPAEQEPAHVIVTMPQPLSVPPEKTLALNHSPSHMIVTMPQAMNMPPLMVAAVYDEPSLEDQPVKSVQTHLETVIPFQVDPTCSRNTVATDLGTSPDENIPLKNVYGWNEDVSQENDELRKTSELPSVATPVPQKTKTETDVSASAPTKNLLVKTETTACGESLEVPSNYCLHVSPRSRDSEIASESSEPEITEYNFETGRLVPSTNSVLADEISSVTNVRIINYTSIDESVLDADASVTDSTRCLVGDPVDERDLLADCTVNQGNDGDAVADCSEDETDGVSAGIGDDNKSCKGKEINTNGSRVGSPDVAHGRRSPDGDSMKSVEGVSNGSAAATPQNSPQKKHVKKREMSPNLNEVPL